MKNFKKTNHLKKGIYLFALLNLLLSCTSKWDHTKSFNECMDNAKKHYDMNQYNNKKGAEVICNCIAEKMVKEFKSQSEANNNPVKVIEIGDDCKKEYAKTLTSN